MYRNYVCCIKCYRKPPEFHYHRRKSIGSNTTLCQSYGIVNLYKSLDLIHLIYLKSLIIERFLKLTRYDLHADSANFHKEVRFVVCHNNSGPY